MKIHILIAQRKCMYPGQYAPETLACMSEAEFDDNPEYLENAREENIASKDFTAVEIITIEVKGEEVYRRLFPKKGAIEGTVIS